MVHARRLTAALVLLGCFAAGTTTGLHVGLNAPNTGFLVAVFIGYYLVERYPFTWSTLDRHWMLPFTPWPLTIALCTQPGAWLLAVVSVTAATTAFVEEQRIGTRMAARVVSSIASCSAALLIVEHLHGSTYAVVSVAVSVAYVVEHVVREQIDRLGNRRTPWTVQRWSFIAAHLFVTLNLGLASVRLWDISPGAALSLWAPLAWMIAAWLMLKRSLYRSRVLDTAVTRIQWRRGASTEEIARGLLAATAELFTPKSEQIEMVEIASTNTRRYTLTDSKWAEVSSVSAADFGWVSRLLQHSSAMRAERDPETGKLVLLLRFGTLEGPPQLLVRTPLHSDSWPSRRDVAELAQTLVDVGSLWLQPDQDTDLEVDRFEVRDSCLALAHLVTRTDSPTQTADVLHQLEEVTARIAASIGVGARPSIPSPRSGELTTIRMGKVDL